MIKNAILYVIRPGSVELSKDSVDYDLTAGAFAPCAPTEPSTVGLVPPATEMGEGLSLWSDQDCLLSVQFEDKVIPTDALKRRVEAMAKDLEANTGRKPGSKARKELKEQALHELLPTALTKRTKVPVWISVGTSMLCVGTSSQARADRIVSMLVKLIDGLAIGLMSPARLPTNAMGAWLMEGEAPAKFTLDDSLELRGQDERKSVVRYERLSVDSDEIREHLKSGKAPTKLAMTYDDRVSFVLTDTMVLQKIELLDLVFEGDTGQHESQTLADLAICAGELKQLIAALIEELGGLLSFHDDNEKKDLQ